jgi:hypothetical protein
MNNAASRIFHAQDHANPSTTPSLLRPSLNRTFFDPASSLAGKGDA